jgi:4-carboxymuconolactone decarboxylase
MDGNSLLNARFPKPEGTNTKDLRQLITRSRQSNLTEDAMTDRYDRGLENFRRITGQAGKSLLEAFDKTAPDLERYIMEFVFGDIYSRPVLDVKQRQLAAISALAALGTCEPQLVVHINGALSVGCTEAEIVEIILAIAVFAGFPAAINAMVIAKQVFAERAAGKK